MEYDLTKQLCQFLDAHLMLPLVDFLKTKSIYPEEQINKAKCDILEQTGLCEIAISFYESIGKDTKELQNRKQKLSEQILELSKECEVISNYIESKKLQQQQQQEAKEQASTATTETIGEPSSTTTTVPTIVPITPISISSIADKVSSNLLNSLFKLAKLSFEIGKYKVSRDYLEVYTTLSPHGDKYLSALWGILESDILLSNWSTAIQIVPLLKQQIDLHGSPVDQLYQRAWLVHRSLFIYFNFPENRPILVDLLLDEKYLIATQTAAPYILRYLAIAIITNKKKQQSMLFHKHLNLLVRIIEQETYTYRDPVTLFIHNLYVKFNFEEAQNQLSICQKVIASDYFLVNYHDEFMEAARTCIFETYCNIHENIDIDMLSRNLGIPAESSEKWIVEAIRNARFNAKIDSANNQIKMFSQHNNSYRQVINKTKPLFNLGIEIVVGINDSKSQQTRKLDQNNRQNKNRQQRPNQNNQNNQNQNNITTTTNTTSTTNVNTSIATVISTA